MEHVLLRRARTPKHFETQSLRNSYVFAGKAAPASSVPRNRVHFNPGGFPAVAVESFNCAAFLLQCLTIS